MAEKLILVPPTPWLLTDTKAIDPTYPRTYKPAEMRAWADDLGRLYAVVEEDRSLPIGQGRLDRWMAADRSTLSPEARRLTTTYDKFFADPNTGIKGDLRPDGSLELKGGTHRAHYVMESGHPVPVWVTGSDAELNRFRDACHTGLERQRPELVRELGRTGARGGGVQRPEAEQLGRVAIEGAQKPPERHLAGEKNELTRERGVPLREDGSPSRERLG